MLNLIEKKQTKSFLLLQSRKFVMLLELEAISSFFFNLNTLHFSLKKFKYFWMGLLTDG